MSDADRKANKSKMTSTSFNVGISDSSRLSSRVLRPPGGGHTDIFGGEPEPPRGRRPAPAPASAAGQGDEPAKPTNGAEAPSQNGSSTPVESPIQETPQPAQTAEPKSESHKAVTPTEQSKSEPPKRVRVPPGGFSSGLCMSESIGCGSTYEDEETEPQAQPGTSTATIDAAQFAANIDLRYGGQYLTPEQLPEFCNQLHHLVEVVRNIQSYAKVTGEYPSELERRLEREAREVAALASEARNARESASRARLQRRALKAQRTQIVAHLAKLRENEMRELESSVRTADRKLFKSWEAVREASDHGAFEPLLEEVRNKQAALDCLLRLIENKRSSLSRPPAPRPLPAPARNDEDSIQTGGICKRQDARRGGKRRRREARSVPLSGEPSRHEPQQVTLFVEGLGTSSASGRFRGATFGALQPARASVRDILFFTAD